MTRPKVVLKVSTRGAKAGDTIEVADAETADALVEMGRVVRATSAPKKAATRRTAKKAASKPKGDDAA